MITKFNEYKINESFIRIENNPYWMTKANGEAGDGYYFSLSRYPEMIKYYKKVSNDNYRTIKADSNPDTKIIDFTKGDENLKLLSYMKEEVEKTSKRMDGYIKPKINQSNYQRFGSLIEDYIRIKYPDIDGYIVNHEFTNYLPKGKQLIIINKDAFDIKEIER